MKVNINEHNKNSKNWLLILILAAIITRVIFVLGTRMIGGPGTMDSQTYQSIAMNLIKGNGFSEDGANPSIFVAPLYPLVIAGFYKIFGAHALLIEFFQCILGVGTAIVTFLIARRLFSETIARVVFVIVAFLPELFVLVTFIYTESLFIFLLIATVYAILRMMERPRLGPIAVAGILGGLASLTRGVTMLLPGILLLALLLQFQFRRALKTTLLFTVFFLLPIVPWTMRNYITFKTFVPIAVGNGDVLWTGNYLPFDGKFNYEKTRTMMDSMSFGMNQIERNNFFIREAKKNMAAEPRKTAWLMLRKVYRFWLWVYESVPSGQKRQVSTAIQLILQLTYYPLLLLFIAGLVLTRRRWRELNFLYWLLCYYLGIHVMTLVVPRYRFPILPLMAVFAAFSLCWTWQRLFKKTMNDSKSPESYLANNSTR